MPKIMRIYYDNAGYPYKDSALSVRYPIVEGNEFTGANNTTEVHFYTDNLGQATWVANCKLPNGELAYRLLVPSVDEDGNTYQKLPLDRELTNFQGHLKIGLNGYYGNISVEEEQLENNSIVVINGTPSIIATGVVDIAMNYSPVVIPLSDLTPTQYDYILAILGNKLDITKGIYVIDDITDADYQVYSLGQIFYDKTSKLFYRREANGFILENIDIGSLTINGQTLSDILDRVVYEGELENYYTKQETSDLVDEKISDFMQNEILVVDTTIYQTLNDFLSTSGEEGYIYLYPIDTQDLTQGYYRYVWENNAWLSLGTTEIDLSNYYTKTESDSTFVSQTRTVNGKALSSNITITKSDVGLGNVDNTSDLNKPISNATQAAIDNVKDDIDNYLIDETTLSIEWTDGKYINTVGGTSNNDTLSVSQFIEIRQFKDVIVNFTFSNIYVGSVCFYSNNDINNPQVVGNVITSVTSGVPISVPEGANYIRISRYTADKNSVVLKGRTWYLNPNKVNEVMSKIDSETSTSTFTWIDGKCIAPNGNQINSTSASRTQIISLKGYKAISVNFTFGNNPYVTPLAFYIDEPTNYYPAPSVLVGIADCTAFQKINIPQGAKYLVISRETAYKSSVVLTLYKDEIYNANEKIGMLSQKNQKGVFFGDSIIQGVGVLPFDGGVPTLTAIDTVKEITNAEVYNCGIGGTTLTTGTAANLCDIVDAITGNGTWDSIDNYIENAITNNPTFAGLRTTIGALKTLDFSTVDYIFIAYGTNDWAFGRAIGNNDSSNKAEFVGALRYCLNQLLSSYPKLKVYISTPCYRWNTSTTIDSDTEQVNGKTLREYSADIYNIATLLNIPCKQLYIESSINQYNRTEFLSDGVHRTIAGYRLLGEQYAKFIMSN